MLTKPWSGQALCAHTARGDNTQKGKGEMAAQNPAFHPWNASCPPQVGNIGLTRPYYASAAVMKIGVAQWLGVSPCCNGGCKERWQNGVTSSRMSEKLSFILELFDIDYQWQSLDWNLIAFCWVSVLGKQPMAVRIGMFALLLSLTLILCVVLGESQLCCD